MAFTVEDGTGLVGANAYVTVVEFRDHHTDRGTVTVDYTDTEVEAAIVRATDYTDKRWQFRGYRRHKRQALEWPRANAQDDSGYPLRDVPLPLRRAIAEYALLALGTDLALDPIPSNVSRKTEKVGPIEDTTEYDLHRAVLRHPQAEHWLRQLIVSSRELLRG